MSESFNIRVLISYASRSGIYSKRSDRCRHNVHSSQSCDVIGNGNLFFLLKVVGRKHKLMEMKFDGEMIETEDYTIALILINYRSQ
jgi:hypothetical protein